MRALAYLVRLFLALSLVAGSVAPAQIYRPGAGGNFKPGLRFFGGGALWTPAKLGTAVVGWWDASDLATITQSGGAVSAWANKGSAGGSAVQATAGAQPLYASNRIAWNGTKSVLSQPIALSEQNNTVYLVGDAATNQTQFFFAAGGSRIDVFANSPNGYLGYQFGNGDVATTTSVTSGAMRLIGITATAGVAQPYVDAVALAATSTTGTGNASDIRLGAFGTNTVPLNGGLNEVLWCNRPLTLDERQKLEGYLAWHWGIQATLPAGHPYKNAAPLAFNLFRAPHFPANDNDGYRREAA